MSSDTDHPRQRTVAELLAQHGDVSATGRRRRRREADGSDEGDAAPVGPSAVLPDWSAQAQEPERSVLRDRVALDQREPGGRRRADREPDARDAEPAPWESPAREQGRASRRAPEPQPWDAGPQAPERDGRRREEQHDDQWAPRPRESQPRPTRRGWEPEPPASDLQPWESGPQAWAPGQQEWDGQPREPQDASAWAQGAPAREAQPREMPPRAAAGASPVRDRPTDLIPRVREEAAPADGGLTGPIQQHLAADGADYDQDDRDDYDGDGYERDDYDQDGDDGPPTMVGAAPVGAEAWHRERTGRRGGAAPADDGGPPTEAAAPLAFDDGPAGLGGRGFEDADGFADFYGGGQDEPAPPRHEPPPRRGGRRREEPQKANGFFDDEDSEPDEDEQAAPRKRFTSAVTDSAGQAWAAVLAQWIAGAVGGAALWVGFRFLWRSLPVVALAAAVLVTIGLVVVVRALLRNNDMRTTLFAVLVGLLLTVSPAILVLLGR